MPTLKVVPPVIPAFEAAVANRRRNPLTFDERTLARARSKAVKTTREQILTTMFDPAAPYPGVVPQGITPAPRRISMAMDDQQQMLQVAGWAQQWGVNSSLSEGQGFLGYAVLSELAQRPEYRAITETLAYEMVREGITFKSKGDEHDKSERIAQLNEAFKRLKVMDVLAKACAHDGFFGRGHVYLDTGISFEESTTLSRPDQDELGSSIGDGRDVISRVKVSPQSPLRKLINVEPVWTYPTSYNSFNPLSPRWFKPESWFVMGNRVHSTRLLTFVGREVPDLLKPAYSFGGLSMTQMAMPYVQNWLRTRQAVADLIWSFTVFVLKTNLSESLQVDGEQLFNRAEFFNQLRNNQGLMMLDKDMEDFVNVSASLGGLHELQAQAQEHMAAVSRIPLVKLLGITPTGLNASSEGEIRVFYDWVHAYQEHLFRDNLDRILGLVMLSEFDEIDDDITYEFKGLWQLDEAGEAGVLKTKADIDDAYVAMGAITPEEVRNRLADDPESQYQGLDLSEPLPEPQQPGIDPNTGMPMDPQSMLGPDPAQLGEQTPPNDPNEQELQSPGGLLHPKDPGNRLASSMTTRPASIGKPASLGFSGGYDDDHRVSKPYAQFEHPAQGDHECAQCVHARFPNCEIVAGPIEPVDWCTFFDPGTPAYSAPLQAHDELTWKEELHPRDASGKFATHKQVSSGIHKALAAHGFKTNKMKPKATYIKEHGGEKHKVSVIEPPEGAPTSVNWHHHNGSQSGAGSGNLLKYLASKFGNPIKAASPQASTSTQTPGVGGSATASLPTQAPAPMAPKFAPSSPKYKQLFDDYGFIPLKQSPTQQTYGLPGSDGTVTIKQLKYGTKFTYKKDKNDTLGFEGKGSESLDYYLGKFQGLSPENKAKLGPIGELPSAIASYYAKPVADYTKSAAKIAGGKANVYQSKHKSYEWFPGQSLVVGTEPGKNEGMWKITDGDMGAKTLASGYGTQELNAAFEALHPRGPGGKFQAKPGTPEFEQELQKLKPSYEFQDQNFQGKVVYGNPNSGEFLHVDPEGSWKLHTPENLFHAVAEGDDLQSLYDHFSGKQSAPAPTTPTAPTKLNLSKLKKISGQKGSNPGGVYEDDDGNKYYAKHLQSEDHVKNERLAAALYQLAGASTFDYVEGTDPKDLITKFKTLSADNLSQLTSAQKKMAQQDFAIHAWLANWDAVGLVGDNLGVIAGGDGKPVNLDLGGSLKYRAQGSPKPFTESAGEWDSLRNASINPSSAAFFKDMSPDDLKQSAARLLKFTTPDATTKLREAAIKAGYSTTDAHVLAQTLKARALDVLNRAQPTGSLLIATPGSSNYNPEKARRTIAEWNPPGKPSSAITAYKGSDYHEMNALMRFGALEDKDDSNAANYVRKATAWLDKASTEEDATVWRGVPSDVVKQYNKFAKPGRAIVDDGFISSSTSKSFADNWYDDHGITIKINMPKGSKAATVRNADEHDPEQEVLLQRGTKFRIVSWEKGKYEVTVEQSHMTHEH